jgi:hypothetical protein
MIDISKVKYDFVVKTPQGQNLHLFEIRKSLNWEEPPGEIAQRLNAEFRNIEHQGTWLHKYFAHGAPVFLFSDWGEGWKEIFRGTVWGHANPDQLGNFRVLAYDMLKYLKSKDDRFYKSGTQGRVIIKDIATAWNIPLGQIDGPDVALAKKPYKAQALIDMILDVLADAKYKGAGTFVARAKQGKLDVTQRGQNSIILHFGAEDMTGLLDDWEDIEDLVTRVKIIGSEKAGSRAPVISTMDGMTELGIIQDIVIKDDSEKPSEAQEAAKKILDERGKPKRTINVPAPDIPFVRKGDKVHIRAGALDGYYYVKGIKHDADTQEMLMEVEP